LIPKEEAIYQAFSSFAIAKNRNSTTPIQLAKNIATA